MKCQNAEKLILFQNSDKIPKRKAVELTAHLNNCPSCREFRQALISVQDEFKPQHEPSLRTVQNILREARVTAPEKKAPKIFGLKPALAMASSVCIGLGLFFTVFNPDRVAMEMVVTEAQLMDAENQVVSVMYSGLSEDDLAFNFLMTYEGDGQG